MTKQTLIASILVTKDNIAYSRYADILQIDCDVTKNGNKQQWKTNKESIAKYFYLLDKLIISQGLDIKGAICNFCIKRYYDGIYGKTIYLSVPLERILVHLSKINITPQY